MKKLIFTLTALLTFSCGKSLKNPNFDFSGMEQFWIITQKIEEGKEPSEQDWTNLFNTPGYMALTKSEFRKEMFREYFCLVFDTGKKDSLEVKLNDPGFSGYRKGILKHYITVKGSRAELESQIELLKNRPVSGPAMPEALEYLPVKNIKGYPPVAFVIFSFDGRGYDPIVLDLLASTKIDILPFLAHEFHHYYRNKFSRLNFAKVEKDNNQIIHYINEIQAEGIADQIDKKPMLTDSVGLSRMAARFKKYYDMSPGIIEKLNEIFEKQVDSDQEMNTIGNEISSILPQSGHHPGFFMASTIIEVFGKKKLIEKYDNPFEFFRLYSLAAKKSSDSRPVFSEKAMEFITGFEKDFMQ